MLWWSIFITGQTRLHAISDTPDHTTRCWWDCGMVQQICTSTKSKWKGQIISRSSKANKALIRPVHGGPMHNDIFPKLNNAQHISFIDVSSGYHNLNLNKRSSYLTTFVYHLADSDTRDYCLEQPQQEICSKEKHVTYLKKLPSVFSTVDDILIIGYDSDGETQDDTWWRDLKYAARYTWN